MAEFTEAEFDVFTAGYLAGAADRYCDDLEVAQAYEEWSAS